MENNLEQRMYFLVPYNISPIQQAIQAGHAALEYAHKYGDTPEYIDFIENHKTWIILNGGTTNNRHDFDGKALGTLNQDLENILIFNAKRTDWGIKYARFKEPDLNDALTAICLIVDERVFNREDYPDFLSWKIDVLNENIDDGVPFNTDNDELMKQYIKEVGDDIAFLKEILNTKRLA